MRAGNIFVARSTGMWKSELSSERWCQCWQHKYVRHHDEGDRYSHGCREVCKGKRGKRYKRKIWNTVSAQLFLSQIIERISRFNILNPQFVFCESLQFSPMFPLNSQGHILSWSPLAYGYVSTQSVSVWQLTQVDSQTSVDPTNHINQTEIEQSIKQNQQWE